MQYATTIACNVAHVTCRTHCVHLIAQEDLSSCDPSATVTVMVTSKMDVNMTGMAFFPGPVKPIPMGPELASLPLYAGNLGDATKRKAKKGGGAKGKEAKEKGAKEKEEGNIRRVMCWPLIGVVPAVAMLPM